MENCIKWLKSRDIPYYQKQARSAGKRYYIYIPGALIRIKGKSTFLHGSTLDRFIRQIEEMNYSGDIYVLVHNATDSDLHRCKSEYELQSSRAVHFINRHEDIKPKKVPYYISRCGALYTLIVEHDKYYPYFQQGLILVEESVYRKVTALLTDEELDKLRSYNIKVVSCPGEETLCHLRPRKTSKSPFDFTFTMQYSPYPQGIMLK